ncbi:MAG: FAD-dependent oxidoreductase [Desulfobacula sp.]|nr:FAD-dependent oxidoreductase [Desulfobacula sp.]
MKKNDLYSKEEKRFRDKNKIYATQSVKQIAYSTDNRDFGQVARSIPCQDACPAKTNIPGYIRCVYEKRYGRAYELNRVANVLPGVLGRICSRPCESACRHGEPENGVSVGICHLKRSCADLKPASHKIIEGLYSPTNKHVAVIGSGPAGLATAHDLAILGHKVTIYEAEDKPGGMMMYGIPEFRLPRDLLLLEIKNIVRLGIEMKTGQMIGRDITLDELKNDHDAVVIATGCVSPRMLGVPGEDLVNLHNGLEFMRSVNQGGKPFVGKKVVVIGAGFTAVDCARSAIRLGAADVSINIRKTIEYMRIDETEKHEAQFEGIKTYSLIQPSKIMGENGIVTGIEFIRTRLEKTQRPPYRKSVPIENSQFVIKANSVIAALGQTPDSQVISNELGSIDKNEHKSGIDGVFLAGDFVTGSSDVISAVAGGKKCARAIDEYMTGEIRKQTVVRLENHKTTDRPRAFDFIGKIVMNTVEMDARLTDADTEVETGYKDDQAHEEAKRCYLCNLKYEIDPLACIYCSACIDVAPKDCIKMIKDVPVATDGTFGPYVETNQWNNVVSIAIDNANCIRCGNCLAVCPMDCISVTKTELIEIDT